MKCRKKTLFSRGVLFLVVAFLMRAASSRAVLNVKPVNFQWDTLSPFIFCVHHLDRFPGQPDGSMKVRPELLRGREIGSDFVPKDGFRMYHGESGVPGFPQHPHSGANETRGAISNAH